MATLRRLASLDTAVDDQTVPNVVARILEVIGLEPDEAHALATTAHATEQTPRERLHTT